MTAKLTENGQIQRFRTGQRVIHWLTVASGSALLVTGLFLVIPALTPAAVSGLSGFIHRVFAVVLILIPVLYLIIDRRGLFDLVRRSLRFGRDDLRWLLGNLAYTLGRSRHLPPQGKYNAAQKIHHLLVIAIFLAVVVSGTILWFGKGALGAGLFLAAVIVHNLAVLGLVVITIGHVYYVLVYGALSGMLTGYVSERYVRFEHGKWWEELKSSAAPREDTDKQ